MLRVVPLSQQVDATITALSQGIKLLIS